MSSTESVMFNLMFNLITVILKVIVALSEKSRVHIPYRNTMMTSVLRDRCGSGITRIIYDHVSFSLGGNCMTSMIATCAIERTNIDETISTCRFSQRVALVKNEAIINEELDPKLVKPLKLEVTLVDLLVRWWQGLNYRYKS